MRWKRAAAGAHPRPVAVAGVARGGEVAVQVLLVLRLAAAAAAAAPPAARALAGLVTTAAQDLIPVVIVPAGDLTFSANLLQTRPHSWRRTSQQRGRSNRDHKQHCIRRYHGTTGLAAHRYTSRAMTLRSSWCVCERNLRGAISVQWGVCVASRQKNGSSSRQQACERRAEGTRLARACR